MKIGKLPESLLETLVLQTMNYKRKDIICRSGIGEDTGIIDPEGELIVVSCDPITGSTKNIGHLAVHINCNDLVTSGAVPVALVVCLLLPPEITEQEIKIMMEEMAREAAKIHVEIIGGHTEITTSVNKPIAIVTSIGKVKKDKIVKRKDIRPGDLIAMSKVAALEGTGIIAHENEEELRSQLTKTELEVAKKLLTDISVIREALTATEFDVRYMHDVTEGGVYGACWELSKALNVGISIDKKSIPLKEETIKICEHYNLNPYKLISSGSMLFVFSPQKLKDFKDEMKKQNIDIHVIGEIRNDQKKIIYDDVERPLEAPEVDELYKVI